MDNSHYFYDSPRAKSDIFNPSTLRILVAPLASNVSLGFWNLVFGKTRHPRGLGFWIFDNLQFSIAASNPSKGTAKFCCLCPAKSKSKFSQKISWCECNFAPWQSPRRISDPGRSRDDTARSDAKNAAHLWHLLWKNFAQGAAGILDFEILILSKIQNPKSRFSTGILKKIKNPKIKPFLRRRLGFWILDFAVSLRSPSGDWG